MTSRPLLSLALVAALVAGCSSDNGGSAWQGPGAAGSTPIDGGSDTGASNPDGGGAGGSGAGSGFGGAAGAGFGGVAGSGGDGGSDAGGVNPTGPLVDPTCTDGKFSEPLPDSDANIDDLVAAYTPATAASFVLGVLERRYPTGATLVKGAQSCVDYFLRDTSSAGAVLAQLDVIVHECGHFYDLSLGTNTYRLNDSLLISCAGGSTFARSELYADAFSSDFPPCQGGFIGCDNYADTYLDPARNGSDQGFDMVFEEAVQYVHSLASGLAITNELGASNRTTSHRDGILTFLWYLERYLYKARTEHPAAYTHLLEGDGGCWREAILTLWGQAWLYLEATSAMDYLGISDDRIESLVNEPVLLDEIERLRVASGC